MADDLSVINPQLLTPQMKTLVRVIGLAETLVLLRARGGTDYRWPQRADNAAVLRAILPESSVAALCAALGGQTWSLPKADQVTIQLRNHYIVRSTLSGRALAKQFDLSHRMIKIIKKQHRKPTANTPQQADLFTLDSAT